MNHELTPTSGVARAHGGTGAFVSRWVIRQGGFEVESGADQIQRVFLWQNGAYVETAGVQSTGSARPTSPTRQPSSTEAWATADGST
jgi:hypothetical protein